VHEPQLIILDEPTIGLDAIQNRAVRQLIKSLGGHHTVLLSTHILSEVEVTCNRVLILQEGRILAHDTPDNLQQIMSDSAQIIAEIWAPPADLKACWESIAEVEHFDLTAAEGDYIRCALTARPGVDLRPFIFQLVVERGWLLRELSSSRYSLEDIFVRVTRADREEEP
jgi:ABC-2 type transport system ATP-binding protein